MKTDGRKPSLSGIALKRRQERLDRRYGTMTQRAPVDRRLDGTPRRTAALSRVRGRLSLPPRPWISGATAIQPQFQHRHRVHGRFRDAAQQGTGSTGARHFLALPRYAAQPTKRIKSNQVVVVSLNLELILHARNTQARLAIGDSGALPPAASWAMGRAGNVQRAWGITSATGAHPCR